MAPVGFAAGPLVLLLASVHGHGSVTIGASTAYLHGRVWLVRAGGVGVATGSASVSCRAGNQGSDEDFDFHIAPNARRELWRSAGRASTHCVITASVRGRGLLVLRLRGY
jgi:hypothetical protein